MSQKKIGKTSTTCEYYSLSKTEKIRTQKKKNNRARRAGARGEEIKKKEKKEDETIAMYSYGKM